MCFLARKICPLFQIPHSGAGDEGSSCCHHRCLPWWESLSLLELALHHVSQSSCDCCHLPPSCWMSAWGDCLALVVGGCSKCPCLSLWLFSGHRQASQAHLDRSFENIRSIDLVLIFLSSSVFCPHLWRPFPSCFHLPCAFSGIGVVVWLASARVHGGLCLWWSLIIKGRVEGRPSSLGCLAPHQQPTSSGSTLAHTSRTTQISAGRKAWPGYHWAQRVIVWSRQTDQQVMGPSCASGAAPQQHILSFHSNSMEIDCEWIFALLFFPPFPTLCLCLWWSLIIKGQVEGRPGSLGCLAPHQ